MPPMDADMAFRVEEVLMANGVHLHLGDVWVRTIEGKGDRQKSGDDKRRHHRNGYRHPRCRRASEYPTAEGNRRHDRSDGCSCRQQQNADEHPGCLCGRRHHESFSVITGKPIYRPLGSTANKMGRIPGDVITGGNLEHTRCWVPASSAYSTCMSARQA